MCLPDELAGGAGPPRHCSGPPGRLLQAERPGARLMGLSVDGDEHPVEAGAEAERLEVQVVDVLAVDLAVELAGVALHGGDRGLVDRWGPTSPVLGDRDRRGRHVRLVRAGTSQGSVYVWSLTLTELSAICWAPPQPPLRTTETRLVRSDTTMRRRAGRRTGTRSRSSWLESCRPSDAEAGVRRHVRAATGRFANCPRVRQSETPPVPNLLESTSPEGPRRGCELSRFRPRGRPPRVKMPG